MKRIFATPAARWRALETRDPAAQGCFVYAVATTGIYCRPNCPAKLASREHVDFYETCGEAEKSGYRPCKRCHPNGLSIAERNTAAVAKACRLIESSLEPWPLAKLAEAVGLSRFHFQRVFKEAVGLSPVKYLAAKRQQKVCEILPSESSVTDAIFSAGFDSSSNFYQESGKCLGMTPSEYRRGAAGMRIRYSITPCSLGLVLVAGTMRGICRVSLGYDRESLEKEVREFFPKAVFEPADKDFDRWVKNLIAHLKRPAGNPDLPLDIRCTAFQQRVWLALREIPAGETASYTEIAARIGQPTAARAVARACATNPVAVVIPCHRVVGRNGDLTGYRWGVERKRELLQQEHTLE
jgi:AraC family transcriptional regulator, regulatory protein of adaptative response / methylated-DNA-[protein]-cysteine methyltransferase